MEVACDYDWIDHMVVVLICEITELMSGIRLKPGPSWADPAMEGHVDSIYGYTEGGCQMELRFWAEPRMLYRLAQNMMGEPPQEGEVRECATEFFNILCGRFISEFCKASHTSARFFPPRYEGAENIGLLRNDAGFRTVYFVSGEQELAAFSWTKATLNDTFKEGQK